MVDPIYVIVITDKNWSLISLDPFGGYWPISWTYPERVILTDRSYSPNWRLRRTGMELEDKDSEPEYVRDLNVLRT